MRAALDTNILVYAEGLNGATQKAAALDFLQNLPADVPILPVQVLGELFNVLVRKAGQSPKVARAALLRWHDAFPVADTSAAAILAAVDLARDHRLGIWDAITLAVAAEAEAACRLLLTEDMQEGFTWRGVTVINPFSPNPHPLMAALLDRHV